MHIASIAATVALISSPSLAQPHHISSAYTSLNLDRCERLDRDKEPGSARWRCTGFAGISLYVQGGDDRYDVDAGREDNDEHWSDLYPGREWTSELRLAVFQSMSDISSFADGFAIILTAQKSVRCRRIDGIQ